jgi:hypothetical protein
MEDPSVPAGYPFAANFVDQSAAFYGAVTYALAAKFNVGIQYDRLMTTRAPEMAGQPAEQTSANVVALSAHLGF